MRTYKNKIGIALLVLGSFVLSATAQTPIKPPNPSPSVTLAWTASISPGVTQYFLYYGTATATYTVRLNVGLVTTTSVVLPSRGPTYFFTVTASDGTLESDYSNEVSYAPKLAPTPPTMHPVIVLTVQNRPIDPPNTWWTDAGMDWSLSADQLTQEYRLAIALAPRNGKDSHGNQLDHSRS